MQIWRGSKVIPGSAKFIPNDLDLIGKKRSATNQIRLAFFKNTANVSNSNLIRIAHQLLMGKKSRAFFGLAKI